MRNYGALRVSLDALAEPEVSLAGRASAEAQNALCENQTWQVLSSLLITDV